MYSGKDLDYSLWCELRKGCSSAFSKLYLEHCDRLFRYGYMQIADRQVVEDLVQELFLQIWKRRSNLPEVENIRSYLFRAMANKIADSFEKNDFISYPDALPDNWRNVEFSTESLWIRQEEELRNKRFIQKAVSSLPPRMKQVIYLRYFEDLDYQDICEIMQIQKQVAANMIYRAMGHLRRFAKISLSSILVFLLL